MIDFFRYLADEYRGCAIFTAFLAIAFSVLERYKRRRNFLTLYWACCGTLPLIFFVGTIGYLQENWGEQITYAEAGIEPTQLPIGDIVLLGCVTSFVFCLIQVCRLITSTNSRTQSLFWLAFGSVLTMGSLSAFSRLATTLGAASGTSAEVLKLTLLRESMEGPAIAFQICIALLLLAGVYASIIRVKSKPR